MSNQRYMQRGVSASKEDVHNAIKNIDKGIFPKAFCKIIPDILGGDPEYCNIMHADGAGTKSSLAYLYWKETGDISVWKGIAQDALIMNIDDLLCVGIICQTSITIKLVFWLQNFCYTFNVFFIVGVARIKDCSAISKPQLNCKTIKWLYVRNWIICAIFNIFKLAIKFWTAKCKHL